MGLVGGGEGGLCDPLDGWAGVPARRQAVCAWGPRLDGRLVGIALVLVHASTTSPDVCYLQDLFTAPEARGKGVARALIRATEVWARDQGCDRLYRHTRENNHAARRLYDQVAGNRGGILLRGTRRVRRVV